MSDVLLCVVRSIINVNRFEVRYLPSSHLKKIVELNFNTRTITFDTLVFCLYFKMDSNMLFCVVNRYKV